MKPVTTEGAMLLVANNFVSRAVIECFDGRRWRIVLRGREEFVLRSARQNPKAFAKIETALEEIRGFGLRSAEIEFARWRPGQRTTDTAIE